MTKKRISITFDAETTAALEEIAHLDRTSVARVVRDCVRGSLPAMLEVQRFLSDPHTTSDGALRLAADMESMLSRIVRGVGVVPDDGRPGNSFDDQKSPRSVTRGPNTPKTSK